MSLKLKDIIWEITLRCNKGCKYCGSKDVLREDHPTLEHMIHIAHEIGSYGVDVVTLSGGEPGGLSSNKLNRVVDVLKSYNCDVRIITNGTFFAHSKELLEKFTIIGLSVNTPRDHLYPMYLPKIPHNKIVMVTNFGTHNIWEFDALAEIAKSFRSWQIQLTTGSEFMLSSEGISYLRKKIRELEGVKYILADNLQDEHKCSAGIVSCGITVDGDVIPCLSERTSGSISVQGNLFKRSLKDIWETEFRDIRFGSGWSKSCRNCVSYPKIDECTPTIAPIEKVKHGQHPKPQITPEEKEEIKLTTEEVQKIFEEVTSSTKRKPRDSYGGCFGGNVMSYGVTDWNIAALSCWESEVWK
ncbi:MAG: radical SAM protein [Proteobacteria bacterium]|jgi:radical SAM protein with 4Fe4S-binding SPASM domain|nr:radical SAM protein [Pseudomonadota bacterium]